ncbi:hypothetical protein GCM10011575_44670 [Microlunatus endophyticus]|uniref:Beta-L-arabinofuranosidase, GH127 n=2 Tax=Microlunatus endophyticus TaxID=1716077 RepID=A0A917SGN5_9ACTN|nr:hypothetical protein GCM10011575_44670 [Microlunatus endophyticus]
MLPLGSITAQGWLRDQLRLQADGLTGQLEDIWPDVGPANAWRGGHGDDWERGPYYLDGLVPLAYALGDETLQAKARPWIEAILASQTGDGWFGPTTNDDWWPRMVALKVLTQHAEASGDERVIPFLQRYFRYQADHLPARPLRSWGWARGADNSLSILWLYERTQEDWLLDLVDLIGSQTIDWNSYLGHDLITGPARIFRHRDHCVNVAMGLKKGAVDWARDGRDEHREETERAFANLDRWHGQAHGWFSGDEFLGGREATAGMETCQVVESMFSCEVLAATFADALQGDRLESLAFNQLPASCDPRMLARQYLQQATQIEVSVAHRNWTHSGDDTNIFGLEPNFGCCTANLHQGWPKFVSSLWMRSINGGLRSVAYAPASIRTMIDDHEVSLVVDTDYPFEETVTITVETQSAEPFPLQLRIPTWADHHRLVVDDLPAADPVQDGHVVLHRSWQGRHVIELTLPMAVRIQRRERQSAAVFFGPLSLVHPLGENWIPVDGAPGLGEWEIHRRRSFNVALSELESSVAWPVARRPVPAVPFGLTGPQPGQGSPLMVSATGARATSWTADGAQASPPPASPVFDHGPFERVDLVPYGTARLRVAEFPVIGSWDDADEL